MSVPHELVIEVSNIFPERRFKVDVIIGRGKHISDSALGDSVHISGIEEVKTFTAAYGF